MRTPGQGGLLTQVRRSGECGHGRVTGFVRAELQTRYGAFRYVPPQSGAGLQCLRVTIECLRVCD